MPLGAALVVCGPARANPLGGQVVAGQATISNPNANTVSVGQTSERAVINWQSFSIAPGQTTQFQQPNAQAVTLNRVTGSDLSTIAGQLRANGQVILINQSGIVFSQGSQVDTGGLIATTTDISTKSFVAGQTAFTIPSSRPHASVVNRGRITVGQAGLAALVAPSVANSGVISATLGRVVLAGAQTFTADLYGDGLVSFDITSRVSQSPGLGGALVSNTGQITADGGHILLTADAVDGIIGDLVDAGGTLQARSMGGRTGAIDVIGQGQGLVAVTGLLDTSGKAARQIGGTIAVLGDRVGLIGGALLDASGQSGGGLVLVGGNFHGKGPQQRARVTYVGRSARVNVDALGSGSGGRVAIWSDLQTEYYGLISAQGGLRGGSGGHVEVSGHNLDFVGGVDLTSPRGHAGSLLLDPAIVNIDNNTSIPNQDSKLPTILATDDPGATDHILASAIDAALKNGSVSIAATESINVNSAISGVPNVANSLALTAPRITVGADIDVFQGNLTLTGAVTLDNPSGEVLLSAATLLASGQISGTNALGLVVTDATLHGFNVNHLVASGGSDGGNPNLILDSGTYTAQSGTLSFFGPVTTSGTLVLGSTETDFAQIVLAADTTLDASAAGGVVRVVAADATTSYGQALSIATSGSGYGVLDAAGTITPLSVLTMSGAAFLGDGQAGTSTVGVGINAGIVNIPAPITTVQTTTITTNPGGSITLGPVTGGASDGGIITGLVLNAGAGGVTLHGLNENTFQVTNSGPLRFDTGTYAFGFVSGTESFASVETSGALSFAQSTSLGAVTLEGNTSFTGTLQPVGLTLTSLQTSGPYSATFNDTTNLSSLSLGPVGGSRPLTALSVDIAGSTIVDGNISAASVVFTSPALVQTSVTVDASSGATFASIGTGGAEASLAFDSATGNVSLGSVNLSGSLGILGTLTAASTASTVTLTGNIVAGAIDLAGHVVLAASSQPTISTFNGLNPGGPITLGPVYGPGVVLTLEAGNGPLSFSGFDIFGITANTSGQVSLHAGTYTANAGKLSFGTVTTDGALVLGSTETDFQEIVLAADTRLDAVAAGGTINVTSVDATTAYGQGLTLATANSGLGALDSVGTATPLSFLTATGNTVFGYGQPASGSAVVAAGNVNVAGPFQTALTTSITSSTSGTIVLGQALGNTLGSNATGLTLSAGTGGITLGGVEEASLNLTSAGAVRLDGGIYVIGGGSAYSFGDVITSGALSFGQPTSFGAVTLAADTTFEGYQVPVPLSLASLDSASRSGPSSAAFTSNISQLSLGPVGASGALSNLAVSIAGTTTLTGGTLASASVTFTSPVLLQRSIDVDAPSGARFAAVDAQSATDSLAFSAGTGNITLGPVGQAGPLESLITASTVSTVTLIGNVSAGSVNLAGPVGIGGGDTVISTLGTLGSSGPITLGDILGAGGTLVLQAGTSQISLSGFDLGSITLATSGEILLNSGTYTYGGTLAFANVTTDGTLFLPQATQFGRVTLASDTTLDMTASSPLSLGPVRGEATLTVIGGDVTFGGLRTSGLVSDVTGTETLTTGTYGLGSANYAFNHDVATEGTLTFLQPTSFAALSLLADTTLDSSSVGGALTLGPTSGPFALSILAGTGDVSLTGVDLGRLDIPSRRVLSLNAGTYAVGNGSLSLLGDVTTGGTLSFAQPTSLGQLTLASDTVLATSGQAALTIGGANGGGFGLSATAGQGSQPSGALTLSGPIDGVGNLVLAGGAVALNAAIGATVPVGSVTIDSFGSLTAAHAIAATGDVTLQAASGQSGLSLTGQVQSLAGNVSLVAAGDVVIGGLVSATGGTLLVTSGGTIAEQGQGSVQAGVLTGSAATGSATFGSSGNQIRALAGFTAGGDLLVNDAVSLTVLSPGASAAAALQGGTPAQSSPSQDVTAGGQATLIDAGSLFIDTGASIVAQTVSLGAFGGAINLSGTFAPAGDIYLAASGGLSLGAGGVLRAGGTVRADAGGNVSFASGSTVSAGGDVWVGYGASANPLFSQYGFTVPSGVAGTVTDAAAITAGGNVGVQAFGTIAVSASLTAGTSASGGNVFLATLAPSSGRAGDIVIDSAVDASAGNLTGNGTVSLDAAGNIDEPGGFPGIVLSSIKAAVLVGQSAGWTSLNGDNQVTALAGFHAKGEIATTSDLQHQAGSSFTFNDASPLGVAAAPYSLVTPVSFGTANGRPLPQVTQAISDGAVSGPGFVSIAATGFGVHLDGAVSISSGSFVVIAGDGIMQTGTLTLTAPVSVLDVSGVPLADVLVQFDTNGSAAAAAFASGHPRGFLNSYEQLIAAYGSATATAPLNLADVAALNPGSNLILATDRAPIIGRVDAAGLSVVSAGGSATLAGKIAGVSGTLAARQGYTSFGQSQASQDNAVVFDACDLGAANCGSVIPPPAPALATILNQPLLPQLVTDASGALGSTLGGAGSGLDPQQSQAEVRFLELLPFDEIQQEHSADDIEVERLDTGREDVQ